MAHYCDCFLKYHSSAAKTVTPFTETTVMIIVALDNHEAHHDRYPGVEAGYMTHRLHIACVGVKDKKLGEKAINRIK